MFKRIVSVLALVLVLVSAFSSASPAFAHSGGSKGKVEGSIASVDAAISTVTITPKKGGANVVVKVDATTRVKHNGKPASLADLLVGDKAEAKFNPSTMLASKLEAKSASGSGSSKVEGSIAAVDTAASTVTITPKKGGANVVVKVDATTRIQRNGQPASFADLLVGDKIEAKYNPSTMLASNLEARSASGSGSSKVEGTISAVDTAASTVTITPKKGGANVVVNVDTSTFIKRNDKPAALSDLLVGDKIEAKYNPSTMLASNLEAKSASGSGSSKVEGTISAVDAVASTVTVTPFNGGADVTFSVDASTIIKKNHQIVGLDALLAGDRVEVKYDSATMLAFKIEVKH